MKRPLIIAVLGVLILVATVVMAVVTFEGSDPETMPEQETTPATAPETDESAPPAEVPAVEAEPESDAPHFDIVRIDPQGNTVMAGTATPDSEVVILDEGQEIGRVKTDRRGEWVYLPAAPLESGSRELSLKTIRPDGAEQDSEEVVVLVVPEQEGQPVLALQTNRQGGASRLLQGPAPMAEGGLSVDTLDYDEDGRLSLSGRGKPGASVQVYMDNAVLGQTQIDDQGQWRLNPEEMAQEGSHTIRADLLGDGGEVLARVEMPFDRMEVAAMPDGLRIVVQPGNSLWLLARKAYGEGTSYTMIFDANKGQIRDPDMIYPGQVFIVPSTPPVSMEGG